MHRSIRSWSLSALLGNLRKEAKAGKDDAAIRKVALGRELRRVNGEIGNLMKLVATGAMEADDPDLRENLSQLKSQRDELERQSAMLVCPLDIPTGWSGPRKAEAFGQGLRELWTSGDVCVRQAYLRLLVEAVAIKGDEIRLSGSQKSCLPPLSRRALLRPRNRFAALRGNGVPTGIRTPVYAVRGRRPRPLDDGDAKRPAGGL